MSKASRNALVKELKNLRTSARGESYSIAENVIAEYIAWYNMPWED